MAGAGIFKHAGAALKLALLLCAAGPAWSQQPEVVRIATTAFAEAGKTALNGVAYRVQLDGWLEQELKKRGVRLEWFPVTGDTGATINEAFAGGRIDFASYGDLPSVILNAGNVRTHVVVPAGQGSDQFLLVPTSSTAKSIHDLKGKRISVHRGRPWELGFRHLLEDNRLKPTDFKLVNMDVKPGTAALASGAVDALFMINGYPVEDKGIGRIIWSSKGRIDRKMRAELWAKKDFTQNNPALTELVVTAWLRAQHWSAQDANRDAIIKDGTRNGTPESVVRRSYDDPTLPWKDRWSPLYDDVVYSHYRRVVAFAKEQNLIRKNLNADELLEPKFVNAAIKNLGLTTFWSAHKPVAAAPR
ncbi:ABC transporter substrate-binding protein [Janthinobacterium sp. 17J80-10]|uniref:ABC transporter substrate-binding protein n=1 Tax=Janthinobacterium sp. 17J80-10 TaxID=2497863 RepID=UPI0010056ACB|nr:ABC transporter substrate-binding protein [Janthinobacterium sp. 17J80-10]QAU33961.1 nitrate ABC transporter substrate-binding protein [Janthinobacterium sp. 17J80-10]